MWFIAIAAAPVALGGFLLIPAGVTTRRSSGELRELQKVKTIDIFGVTLLTSESDTYVETTEISHICFSCSSSFYIFHGLRLYCRLENCSDARASFHISCSDSWILLLGEGTP